MPDNHHITVTTFDFIGYRHNVIVRREALALRPALGNSNIVRQDFSRLNRPFLIAVQEMRDRQLQRSDEFSNVFDSLPTFAGQRPGRVNLLRGRLSVLHKI